MQKDTHTATACSVPGCDSIAQGMQEVATLACGHRMCRAHAMPCDDDHPKAEDPRNMMTCSICHAVKEVKSAVLKCGCNLSGRYDIYAFATRAGGEVKSLRMECVQKHKLPYADVAWAYKAFAKDWMQKCIAGVFKDGEVVTINFSKNQIDTTVGSLLGEELKNASAKLATLDLSWNQISGESMWPMATALTLETCHLITLNLSGNQICSDGAKALATAVGFANCRLTSLTLEDTHLGSEGVRALAATALANPNCNLTKLDISRNAIGSEGAKAVAMALGKGNSKLASINLYYNKIQDEGAISIAAVLGNCKLEELNVMYNEISSKGVKAIAVALGGKGCSLASLSVGHNLIDDEGAKAIAASLVSGYSRLASLYLNSAQISDEGIEPIAVALESENCKVTSLALSDNRIGAEGAKSIFAVLGKEGCRLTSLRFGGNQIGFEGEKAMAAVFETGRCKLQELYLDSKRISEEGMGLIRAAFRKGNCKFNLCEEDVGNEARKDVSNAVDDLKIRDRPSVVRTALSAGNIPKENHPAAEEAKTYTVALKDNSALEEQKHNIAPYSNPAPLLLFDSAKKDTRSVFEAEGIWIHTEILDGVDAVISHLSKENVFLVKYAEGKLQVLKTFVCNSSDKKAIDKAQNEYKVPDSLREKTEYAMRPLKYCTKVDGDTTHVEILFEHDGLSLDNVLKKRYLPLNIRIWIKQSLSAMKAAADQGILHADLKPANMAYDRGVLKIIDFGSSVTTSAEALQSPIPPESISGTRCYLPPEVLTNSNEESPHGAIDVYCWGMTFYQILTHKDCDKLLEEARKYRCDPKSYCEFLKMVSKISIPGEGGKELKEKFLPILQDALAYSPYRRPTFADLYKAVEMKEL